MANQKYSADATTAPATTDLVPYLKSDGLGNYLNYNATVAQIVGAIGPISASDLASEATARITGDATTLASAHTYTDSQISTLATVATTGAYADLTGKPTLGDAAAKNTGTTAGTLAAGDDSRITGALSASTAASTYAPINSPTFTGTPAAPTPGGAENSTTLPTTAWVRTYVTSLGFGSGDITGVTASTGLTGGGLSGDVTLAVDTTVIAALASPHFSGVPTAPTASALTNNTQLSTTAYSDSAVSVEALARSTADALKANIASPTLTGTPAAPTAAALTNSTQIATTAYVDSAVAVEASARSAAISAIVFPYDVAFFAEGLLTTSEVFGRFIAPRAFTLASGTSSGQAKAGVAATGSTTVTLAKNAVSFGTAVWSAAGTTAVLTISSTTTFAAGDIITLTGPATADTTLADIGLTLAGTR